MLFLNKSMHSVFFLCSVIFELIIYTFYEVRNHLDKN